MPCGREDTIMTNKLSFYGLPSGARTGGSNATSEWTGVTFQTQGTSPGERPRNLSREGVARGGEERASGRLLF